MKDYLITERPECLHGYTPKVETNCGTLYLTLNELNDKLFEIRLTMGKAGNCVNTFLQIIAIYTSVLLQTKIPREKIISILSNRIDCHCPEPFWKDGVKYVSCMDWILRKITEDMHSRGEIETEEKEATTQTTTQKN